MEGAEGNLVPLHFGVIYPERAKGDLASLHKGLFCREKPRPSNICYGVICPERANGDLTTLHKGVTYIEETEGELRSNLPSESQWRPRHSPLRSYLPGES